MCVCVCVCLYVRDKNKHDTFLTFHSQKKKIITKCFMCKYIFFAHKRVRFRFRPFPFVHIKIDPNTHTTHENLFKHATGTYIGKRRKINFSNGRVWLYFCVEKFVYLYMTQYKIITDFVHLNINTIRYIKCSYYLVFKRFCSMMMMMMTNDYSIAFENKWLSFIFSSFQLIRRKM